MKTAPLRKVLQVRSAEADAARRALAEAAQARVEAAETYAAAGRALQDELGAAADPDAAVLYVDCRLAGLRRARQALQGLDARQQAAVAAEGAAMAALREAVGAEAALRTLIETREKRLAAETARKQQTAMSDTITVVGCQRQADRVSGR